MKLHLPTRLRQALVATFVAVASLATTLSTATLVGGVAAVSLASVAEAAVVGPAESYASGTLPDTINTADSTVELTATEDTEWDATGIEERKNLTFVVDAAESDVKLKAPVSANNKDIALSDMECLSVWIASGCWVVDENTDLSLAGDIYIGGGQLQLKKGVTLANNITLGASTTSGVAASVDNAALRVGQWMNTNQTSHLTGILTIAEDAKIAFQASCSIDIQGTLTGSGNLALGVYDGTNNLIISGNTSSFTGAITLAQVANGSVTLKLGADAVQAGGLNGSFAVGLDTVTASTLTLDVAESATWSHTGTLASGISLVKDGAGSQSFASAIEGNVTVNAGTLTLLSVTGDVTVAGGIIRLESMEGLTSMTVKSGATAYLPDVAVSATATNWVNNSVYYTASSGVDMSVVTIEEGGSVQSNGGAIKAANADDRVYVEMSCLSEDGSLTIQKGNVMVCDPNNLNAVAQSIASASKIILDGGTLFSVSQSWTGGTPVKYVVNADLEIKEGNGGGTLRAYGDDTTNTVDSTTYTGAITGNGALRKTDGGRVVLAGDVSGFSGSLIMEGGILEMASSGTMNLASLSASNSTLAVADNVSLTLRGTANNVNMTFGQNSRISLGTGSLLDVTHTDQTYFSGSAINGPGTMKINTFRASSTTLTIAGGAQLEMTHYRSHSGDQTVKVTDGSSIVVTGNVEGNANTASFLIGHWNSNVNLEVLGEGSYLESKNAITRLCLDGTGTLTVKDSAKANLKGITFQGNGSQKGSFYLGVAEGGDATVLIGASGIVDFGGTSTMLLGNGTLGATAGWSMTGSNKVELIGTTGTVFDTDVYDVNVAPLMKGSGNLIKQGSGTLTLAGFEEFSGTLTISEGGVAISQASALNKLVTNGGSLVVDAAAPVVLTLGATEGVISLLVKNAASIAAEGVDIFGGTLIPENANVVVDSMIADELGEDGSATGNQFVAIYEDGKLKKTALTTVEGGNLTWVVDGVSNNWGLTTGANWDKSGTAQRWVDGSAVTFDDENGESISVVSAVTASSATVSNGTQWEWVLGSDKLTITNGVTIAENASLTLTGASAANFAGVVSGAGTLRLQNAGLVNLKDSVNAGFVIAQAGQGTLNTLVVGEGSALELGNSDHQAAIDNITHLVIEKGGRFDLRHGYTMNAGDDGKTITIAGIGNSVALTGQTTSGPAAALSFSYATNNNNLTIGRTVILSDDATIYVANGKTGILTGGLDTADHTMTLIGGGTLQFSMADAALGNVVISANSTLAYHHSRAIGDNGGDRMTVAELTAGESAADTSTLSVRNHGGIVEVEKLAGAGKLIVDGQVSHSTQMGAVLINGKAGAGFNGEIEVKQTNTGTTRRFVLATDSTDALAASLINLSTAGGMDDSSTTSGNATAIGFAISGAANNIIKIQGIKSTETLGERVSLVSSNSPYEATAESAGIYSALKRDLTSIADGEARTLEIIGSADCVFYGKVSAGVNLLMNGTRTQSFAGNLDAFNGTVEVKKGTLEMAGLGSASAITLAGEGATLGVTSGVSGKSLTATAVGAVLSADLTMAGGSLALGTDDAEWAKTGGLSLDGHKLVIDSANLGALSANLGTEEYTGDVVQLFTNVGAIEDAAGNALSITNETKLGSLFNTGTDTALGDYLLNWDAANGTLSLIMKGEIADLVWNDASDNNEWKNAGTHTNWKDGSDDSRFVMGDNVSFAGSTGETVTIVDTVNPLNVTVSSGDYTWTGSGSVEAAGKLTVADNAQLTIENIGNKKFTGGVEVGSNAVLSVENLSGWSGTVSGDGCFELATGTDVGALSQFVSSEKELGMFLLYDEGTCLSVSNTDESLLSEVGTVQVVDGAKVKVTNDTVLDTKLTLDSTYGVSSVEVAADKTAILTGKFTYFSNSDEVNVTSVKGDGTLVLTGGAANLSSDASQIVPNEGTLSIESGTLKIDAANSTVGVHQLGSVRGEGSLLLSNGSVEVVSLADTLNVEVVTETAGDVVSVGGVAGSDLDSITLVQGTQLTGVQGDITVGGTDGTTSSMALTLDAVNVGSSSTIAADKNAMIGQSGKLIINDGAVVTLSVDAIASLLNAAASNSESVYLHLTTGTLEVADESMGTLVFKSGATSINLLESFGVRLDGTEGGSLKLSGGAVGIYTAAEDSTVTGYKELSAYQSTVVAPGKSLEMMLDGAADDGSTAVVNNLIGGTDSTLLISNRDDASTARVELKNKLQSIDTPDPAEAVGADTEFAGDIDGTSGVGDVEIVISGDGTLTVGGNVNTAQLTMSEGGLTLNGEDNTITTLTDDGVADDATDADSTLMVNDLLTVEGASELSGTSVGGDGTLSLKDTLKLSNAAALDGVAVELQKDNFGTASSLLLDGVQGSEISALNGGGSLQGGNGAELTITGEGGSFSGSLDELPGSTGGATLKIAEGASQTLDRVTGSTAWSVENAGDLTINITNPAVTTGSGTNNPLTLDSLTMKSGSTTTVVLNTDAPAKYLNLQELVVEDGATVALQSTGLDEVDFGGSITLAYAANGVTVGDDVNVELGNSAAFKKVKEAELVSSADGKSLVLQTTYHDTNQYEQMASSGNGAAGAALLWSVNTGALKNGSALKAVDEAVNELSKQGAAASASQADKIMAAVAGSSTAILGSALSSDVERQLRAIRNRTTTMGVAQTEVNEGMPYVNAWLNAEGDHHEMDADGWAAGYTRDSWGGTVGFDVDLTPSFTMGMAVTAMYGDIESESADKAEGDFDTQYLSLFARYSSNAWTHTFVATVGRADMTLDRTVNYGKGSYETTGDTEGTSFGFMYEVGRVFSLTEDGDVCLQPVANVTFRHSTVDGYEESGCDATLAVDEQTYSAVTLGVGARLQAVIGTSIYNRASILEARALAKFDMGDRESEADVRLTQGGNTATVKSAELGAFGAEFGVGVTVPVGSNAGSIFVDGSAEIRSGYTNINGTVGYRINF